MSHLRVLVYARRVWVPGSLPVTKSSKGIDVTLSGLTVAEDSLAAERVAAPKWNLRPQLAATRDGRSVTDLFEIENEFEDAFGTTSDESEFRLNALQRAWKLKTRLWLKENDIADLAGAWHVASLVVPGAGAATKLDLQSVVEGVTIRLTAIGGAAPASDKTALQTDGGTPRAYSMTVDDIDLDLRVIQDDLRAVLVFNSTRRAAGVSLYDMMRSFLSSCKSSEKTAF